MALVVLCAVLKIPVMRAGVTPPRCDRRRRRGRRFRRGIWTFGRPRASPCLFKLCWGGQTRGRAIDFGFSSILVNRRDGIGMRDAGNAASHGTLTGIFGQQIHLTSQFVLIHARSSGGGGVPLPRPHPRPRPRRPPPPPPPPPQPGGLPSSPPPPPGGTPPRPRPRPRPRGRGGEGVRGVGGRLTIYCCNWSLLRPTDVNRPSICPVENYLGQSVP